MKSVLISIQPKWCELIASGKKTVEVRKTKPKLETPFKVYIYETQGRYEDLRDCRTFKFWDIRQKVIGEFVCDVINPIYSQSVEKQALCAIAIGNGDKEYYENSCVSYKEAYRYFKNAKMGYGWHISNLVIYDKPRELGEFSTYTKDKCPANLNGTCLDRTQNNDVTLCKNLDCQHKKLTRPPQSWCYVESEVDTE